jgi:hypothetical protein
MTDLRSQLRELARRTWSGLRSRAAAWDRRIWAVVAALLVLLLAVAALPALVLHRPAQPTSVRLNLHDGQTDVPLDQALVFRTSQPVALAAIRSALTVTPTLASSLTASRPAATVFTWTPNRPWAEATEYTVTLRATRDAAGRPVPARRWRFTTILIPRVVSLSTGSRAAVADAAVLAVGTPLQIAFNTAMDTGSVGLLANQAPLGLSWAADGRSATLDVGSLHIGHIALELAAGGRASGGEALAPWRLSLALVSHVDVSTVPLEAPALVQVPNDPAARDQAGLQAAAMVFEYVTEGGITRFTAIFTNAPAAIGPVRSGRLISFALTRHYRGELYASGLSVGTAGRLAADPVHSRFDDTPGRFYRTRDRPAPNNLFIAGSTVQSLLVQGGTPGFSLPAASLPAASGPDAPTIGVPEHESTYHYDAASGTYTKQIGPSTLTDAALGQPLRIQMLIVLHTTATQTNYVEDVNGQPGLDFDMESGGRAELYVFGQQLAGRWVSPARDQPLRFELDGGGVVVPPALTWVDVVRS